jgi:hypothetical protein
VRRNMVLAARMAIRFFKKAAAEPHVEEWIL